MNFQSGSRQPFALVFDFSALLLDNLDWNSCMSLRIFQYLTLYYIINLVMLLTCCGGEQTFRENIHPPCHVSTRSFREDCAWPQRLPPPQALREHFGQVRKMRVPSSFALRFNLVPRVCLFADTLGTRLLYVSKSGPQICTARKCARKKGLRRRQPQRLRGVTFKWFVFYFEPSSSPGPSSGGPHSGPTSFPGSSLLLRKDPGWGWSRGTQILRAKIKLSLG
jgi:hypothetical protein